MDQDEKNVWEDLLNEEFQIDWELFPLKISDESRALNSLLYRDIVFQYSPTLFAQYGPARSGHIT